MGRTDDEPWAETFAAMSHEDRVMTIVEDGSTLDALIAEARAALTADEAKRIRVALIFGDPANANPPQPDPKLNAAKAKLKAIEAANG